MYGPGHAKACLPSRRHSSSCTARAHSRASAHASSHAYLHLATALPSLEGMCTHPYAFGLGTTPVYGPAHIESSLPSRCHSRSATARAHSCAPAQVSSTRILTSGNSTALPGVHVHTPLSLVPWGPCSRAQHPPCDCAQLQAASQGTLTRRPSGCVPPCHKSGMCVSTHRLQLTHPS